jgi:hypothetical protein
MKRNSEILKVKNNKHMTMKKSNSNRSGGSLFKSLI